MIFCNIGPKRDLFVTQPDTHLHGNFERSSGLQEHREIDIGKLLELRKTARGEYWAIARDMRGPTPEDLEILLPRASLPKLADGMITYRYRGWYAEEAGKVIEVQTHSHAASRGKELVGLIETLEVRDPDFLIEYFDSLYESKKVDLIMALHMVGERKELKDYLIKKLPHIDDFMYGLGDKKEKFLDNEYYPFESELRRVSEDMASAYILKRAPATQEIYEFGPDAQMRPFLEFARTYGVNAEALEALNTKSPLPKSLSEIHAEGGINIKRTIGRDIQYAQWMSEIRKDFPKLSDEEKLEFGQKYLQFLSESYGVHPAPVLAVVPGISSKAEHARWDVADKETSFAHPLGRINIQKPVNSFHDFLETLSHEFTHALEDLALYTINTDFQEWHQQNPDAVRLGNEKMQKNLRSAALAISFNTACNLFAGFAGSRENGYADGIYYGPEKVENDKDGERQKKVDDLYSYQLRERHASLYEYLIAKDVEDALNKFEKGRDPLAVFMMAQNGMFKADEFIKETLIPSVPAEERARYQDEIGKIEVCFKKADAREATYYERMLHMGRAFIGVYDLIWKAVDAGHLSMNDTKVGAMAVLAEDIAAHTTQAIRIMKFNEQISAEGANTAPLTAQMPA